MKNLAGAVFIVPLVPVAVVAQSAGPLGGSDLIRATVTAPASPPARICGNSALLNGPSARPPKAVKIPAGDNSVDLSEDWNIHPNTVYWLAPGAHTLGLGPYSQVQPKDGDTFIGAPGAVLDGQGSNQSAFTGSATDVTIEYLTIQNFAPPGTQYVVNHDMAADWTVAHNTIQDNGDTQGSQLGAGLGLGNRNVVKYNCISHNGEYGMNAGGNDTTFSHNEVSWNGISFFPDNHGCGCSGGIKYWVTSGAVVEDNYIHDNYNVGLWFDTDNTGALVQGNWISGSWAEGLIYEISYNADINANTFVDNGWGVGSTQAGGVAYGGAIFLNGSGGDANVPGKYSGSLDVTDNVLTDNWDGLIVYQNPNRLCGSGSNASTGYCTLDDPSVFTTTSCAEHDENGSPSESPDYFDGCQWKAQNVTVSGNEFNFNPADIRSATPNLPLDQLSNCPASASALANPNTTNQYWCGFNGMYALPGSGSGGPSQGWTVVDAIMNLTNSTGEAGYNNHWSDNSYNGPWAFQAAAQGLSPVQTDLAPHGVESTLSFAAWRSVWHQDHGSVASTTPGFTPPPSTSTTTTTTTTAPPHSTTKPVGRKTKAPRCAVKVTLASVGKSKAIVTTSGTKLAVDAQRRGDLMVLAIDSSNSKPPVATSVKGGGVAKWRLAARMVRNTHGYSVELWTGRVTRAGRSTIRVKLDGFSNRTDLMAQELRAATAGSWAVVTSGRASTFGGTWYYPSLPATACDLYYGVGLRNNDGTLRGGGTPGYTYTATGLPAGELVVEGATRAGSARPVAHNSDRASYEDALGVVLRLTVR